MSTTMRTHSLVLSGLAIGAIAFYGGKLQGHTQAAANVQQSVAVLESIERMHGQANAAVAIRYGYKFRTDSAGRVHMLYADGWQCVEQECK